ncbi:hypothetical protein DAPPUDRAFT_264071 [Daphnia pulex]|uniref:Uncharacterized protein n=1 Tax=Daphnia pulex TaxID=6669 RepID=E9HQU4_DAPPU|nr:hypothetical protein DAPPUDRAFT_264071 [Daphnia pulex]|eukprot:EFX65889.1 hypothetical protein DAPPUDRAFT_264071 [Daphnia pulex]
MFETLYRSEKVAGYIFRQKEQIPVAAEQLPVSSFTATNGVEYSSSDVRYKNRPLEINLYQQRATRVRLLLWQLARHLGVARKNNLRNA